MDVLQNLLVVSGATLKACRRFPPFESVRRSLVRPLADRNTPIYFISHRWETPEQPDPQRYQWAILYHTILDHNLYWYDYSCSPQRCDGPDQQYLAYILNNLTEIVRNSELIVIRRQEDNYFSRGWCFHEWFTAQFLGGFGRTFLGLRDECQDEFEIERNKRKADRLLGGHYEGLDSLHFSKHADREFVLRATRSAAITAQKKIIDACLEFMNHAVAESHDFPDGIRLTNEGLHQRFARLVRFIKAWTLELQPVEPVSDRIAMFFHKNHWDAMVDLSRPIATRLLQLEYETPLRPVASNKLDLELRRAYDVCQRRMPEPRYAVTAFLCFFLMGYEIYESAGLTGNAEELPAAQCGLISQQLLEQGRYEEAEAFAHAQLKKAFLSFDDDQVVKALSKLGRVRRDIGDFNQAETYYNRAWFLARQLGNQRSVAIALDQMGTLLRMAGDARRAIELYGESLHIHLELGADADIGVEYGNLGCAYWQSGEKQKAKDSLQEAMAYSMQADDVRNWGMWQSVMGEIFKAEGDFIQAKSAYQHALTANSIIGNPHLDRELRRALELLEDPLDNAVAPSSSEPDAMDLTNEGLRLAEAGRTNEALAILQEAVQIDPRLEEAWSNMATVLGELGRHEEALAACEEAIRIDSRYEQTWYNKGGALLALGRREEALECFEEALRINPCFAEAWTLKGAALFGSGRKEEALAACEEALRLKPSDALARSDVATMLAGLDRKDEALAAFEEVLRVNPDLGEAWSKKGVLLVLMRRNEEALSAFDEALHIDPVSDDAWQGKGAVLSSLGRKDEALGAYDMALRFGPSNANAWLGKGTLLLRGFNDPTAAHECFQRAFELGCLAAKEFIEFCDRIMARGEP